MKQILTGMSVLAFSALASAQTSSPAPAPNPASTAAKLETVKPTETKWGAALFYGQYAGFTDANKGELDSSTGFGQLGVSYKLNKVEDLKVFQEFTYNDEKAEEMAAYDLGIRYRNKDIGAIAGNKIASDTRVYLPAGEWASDIGRFELRETLATSMNIADKTSLALGAQVRLYGYTEDEAGQYSSRQYLTSRMTYELAKMVSPYLDLTYRAQHFNAGTGQSLSGKMKNPDSFTDFAVITVGSGFSINDNISMDFYAEQYRNLSSSYNYEFLDADETNYSLEMSVSI